MFRLRGLNSTAVPHTLRIIITWLRHIFARELRSLRGRLSYTLLGLLFTLLAVELWQHSTRLQSRESLLRKGHERAAAASASTFRRSLDQLYRQQQIIGSTVLTGRMVPEQIQPYLEDIASKYGSIASLQVISSDGIIRYSVPPVGYQNSVAQEPFFKALTPQNPHYLSDLYTGADQAMPRFRVASLIAEGPNAPSGIVSIEFYDHAVLELLSRWSNGQTEVLLDGQGRVVFTTQGSGLVRLVQNDPDFARAARMHRPGPVDVNLSSNEELMGFATPIPDTSWTIAYLRPEKESLAVIQRDMQTSLVVAVFVVLALGVAIFAVIWVSLRPLVRLSAATRMLGNLDLEFRLPRGEVEEFEPLVDSFNRMAGDLERAHRQLTEANRSLEERVRERTRQLEAEHDKVLRAERLSTLGLLSSAIAHDLRSPLNTISLNAHWLRAHLGRSMDEKMDAKLQTVERELRRADRIIQTLLAFARTGEPKREPIDLNRLVSEVAEANEPPPIVNLRVELDAHMPTVSVDSVQMFQVLENLIKNAVQAMPQGGLVRVTTEVRGESCRIRVSDTGPGIPPEMLDTVFEPLVTTKRGGTGIGLALCKRIVDAHGGTLSVQSRPGEGATFQIDLPLEATSGPASSNHANELALPSSRTAG